MGYIWEGDERRREPRVAAQLSARLKSVLVYSAGTDDSASGNMLRVPCQTRDISATGLSLAVPADQLDERYLPRESCLMLVILELPTGWPVALEAAPAHHKRVEEEGRSLYLVGASIRDVSAADRARYLEYLGTLA